MHILITNVYSYKNKGDAAIVLALVQETKRVFPKSDILIQTADVLHDTDVYGEPVTSSLLWILLSSVRDNSLFKRLWTPAAGLAGLIAYLMCFRLFRRTPSWLLSKDLRRFVAENKATDIAIACGGGYLRTASSSPRDVVLLGVTCLNFLTAKYLGKPVYLYSQSIGPVHGRLQRAMMQFVLQRVDVIEPREDISVKFLSNLRLDTPIIPTADPALLLGGNGRFPKQVKLKPRRLRVGITVRKWFHNKEDLDHYMQAIAHTIDYLVKQHNAEVFYIPQVIAENFGDDDRIIAQKVWKLCKYQDNFTVVADDLHPFEIIGLCGKMDIFIGTRMHSNIFALINYVPVVAIEYEHKTRGIMRGLGLEKLTIDIKDATAGNLQSLVDDLLNHREQYVASIRKNLPKQIAESHKAMEVIKAAYEKTA